MSIIVYAMKSILNRIMGQSSEPKLLKRPERDVRKDAKSIKEINDESFKSLPTQKLGIPTIYKSKDLPVSMKLPTNTTRIPVNVIRPVKISRELQFSYDNGMR